MPAPNRLGAGLSAVKQKRLGETVWKEKHALLLDAGRRAQTAKRWDEADGFFKQASDAEFAAPLRLQALLETAALWKAAGRTTAPPPSDEPLSMRRTWPG